MAEHNSLWRGRRVLVTGCTGFLGGALTHELFARGAEVVGLIHERPATDIFGANLGGRVHFVHGRADNVFRVHSAMAVHEVSAVFHLAASEPFCEERGTATILQAARLYSRRVPVVTALPLQQLALAKHEETHEDRLSIVRFGEVFGPGDRKLFRVVPSTAIALHSGGTATFAESLLSTVPAGTSCSIARDGQARDFVFIRDAARACLLAAEATLASGPADYSFRSGWLMTDRQMASAVRDVFASRLVEMPDSVLPTNPLGWKPAQSLAESLGETLAWYSAFLQAGCATSARAVA